VLSGLLNEQAAEVMTAYEKWFEFEPVAIDDDWCRLSARKNK
jgi:ribosomal protein L11 methyltransferase